MLQKNSFCRRGWSFYNFHKDCFTSYGSGTGVIFLFSFIGTYSEYVISSVFLQSPKNFTLAIGLQSFITNQFAAHWTLFAAAAVLVSLPLMLIFMLLQKYIQNGLTAGGVKG